jgi:hypothetical protein
MDEISATFWKSWKDQLNKAKGFNPGIGVGREFEP